MTSERVRCRAGRAPATYTDIRYETAEGIAKITIDRPEVRNAFRPLTVRELIHAFDVARDDPAVGVVILTGEGPERVLQRRGPEDPRRRRLHRRARHRATERPRPPGPDPAASQTGRRDGGGLRDRRRPRAARRAATSRSRPTTPSSARPGRGSDRSTAATGSGCSRASRREAREGGLVPLPPVRRGDRARVGAREHGRPARRARGETVHGAARCCA